MYVPYIATIIAPFRSFVVFFFLGAGDFFGGCALGDFMLVCLHMVIIGFLGLLLFFATFVRWY